MSPEQIRWQRAEPSRFRFRFWPDEAAANAFDLRSGSTHCVSPLGLELIALLDGGARTTAELLDELHDVFEDREQACGFLHNELTRLSTIGLVAASS